MEKRHRMIVDALARQAADAISEGTRFQVRRDLIGDDDDLRRFITRLAVSCHENVRASEFGGLVTFYGDESDGTVVTVATIDK